MIGREHSLVPRCSLHTMSVCDGNILTVLMLIESHSHANLSMGMKLHTYHTLS